VFINGVRFTSLRVRSSPYYFTHVFSPRETTQAKKMRPAFPKIARKAPIRVASLNEDTQGGDTPWLTVIFDITNPILTKLYLNLKNTFMESNLLPFSTPQSYALLSTESEAADAANNKERLGVSHDMCGSVP
jgi:hypothetical protein